MPQGPQVSASKAFVGQTWAENPIFRQVLGICSALAVTNLVFNTVLMCAGLIWATSMSALTSSLLRNYTPRRVRIMVQVLIIAVYVICVDIAIRAFYPDIHQVIGPYVGLIITNCIVLGRLEGFSSKNPPWPAFMDGIGAGVGYSIILLGIAVIRETLGFGTLLGYPLGLEMPTWIIMVMPPGAFFVLAILVWVARAWDLRREAARSRVMAETPAAGGAPVKGEGK
jgi:Na+-transporting NADH:ubiquinone oxidoreductase subunit D